MSEYYYKADGDEYFKLGGYEDKEGRVVFVIGIWYYFMASIFDAEPTPQVVFVSEVLEGARPPGHKITHQFPIDMFRERYTYVEADRIIKLSTVERKQDGKEEKGQKETTKAGSGRIESPAKKRGRKA